MEYEKSCGIVIYRDMNGEPEFLAVKSETHNHWGFPKGHIEEGESEQETAEREVLEETGLRVKITEGFRASVEYSPYENVHKEVVYFLAEVSDGVIRLQEEEIKDYRWTDYEDLSTLLSHENDKHILTQAMDYIQGK